MSLFCVLWNESCLVHSSNMPHYWLRYCVRTCSEFSALYHMHMGHVPPLGSWACVVGAVTWLWLEDPWFASWRGKRFFFSKIYHDQVWGPSILPFSGCMGIHSQRGKAARA